MVPLLLLCSIVLSSAAPVLCLSAVWCRSAVLVCSAGVRCWCAVLCGAVRRPHPPPLPTHLRQERLEPPHPQGVKFGALRGGKGERSRRLLRQMLLLLLLLGLLLLRLRLGLSLRREGGGGCVRGALQV